MRTEKCENCGMSEYEYKDGAYFCTYCDTRYEDQPKTTLQTVLNFTERQIDKFREPKNETAKHIIQKTEEEKKEEAKRQKRGTIIAGIVLVSIFLLALLMLILDKQGIIDLSDSTESITSFTNFLLS